MSQIAGDTSQIKDVLEYSWLDRFNYQIERDSSNGEAVGYHKNGKVYFKYPLKDGDMHGTCRIWDENGALLIEEVYNRGFLDGVQRKWYPSGQLNTQQTYVRGLSQGLCTIWDEEGNLVEKRLYVLGNFIGGEIHRILNTRGLTAQDIIGIGNAEVRRTCLELVGYSWFLSKLDHQIIDRAGDYELVSINWHKKEEPIYLVKVKCPSTGAFYTLRVPPRMKTVKDAVAWTFGMDKNEYNPESEA
jgi:hypothetical protein